MNNTVAGKRGKAIVIGGGMAGLLSARVLSEHYDQVVVLDRDDAPAAAGHRRGVPQSFHLHQMLPRGGLVLEELFPGFFEDVLRLGAFPLSAGTVRWINRFGSMVLPAPEGVTSYSRVLVEQAIRERVQELPNVHFRHGRTVIELFATPDGGRITGVGYRSRGRLESGYTMSADLVVDASGRSSKLPQWLSALGHDLPPEETVTSSIGYSTRYYRARAHRDDAVLVIENDCSTGNPMGGVLKRVEDDIWIVGLSGIGGHHPATDAAGFDRGLTELISPALAEALRDAEPLTAPRGYRIPASRRRHYEQLSQWPAGLVVLGDALSSVDPIYGQGMTVAAIQAQSLGALLRDNDGPAFERVVLARMLRDSYPAWWLSALEDLRWPGVRHIGGVPIKRIALLHKYFDLAVERMTHEYANPDDPSAMNYMAMTGLLIPPSAVVNGAVLEAMLAGADTEAAHELRTEIGEYGDNVADLLDDLAAVA